MTAAVLSGRGAGSGWAPYLAPGERLLWEGAPDPRPRLTRAARIHLALGAFLILFAVHVFHVDLVAWTSRTSGGARAGSAAAPGLFAFFLALGAASGTGHIAWDAFRRSRTRYALSDRRAFIAERAFAPRLTSFPIDRGTSVELELGPLPSINFAQRIAQGPGIVYAQPVGFECLPDAGEVYRLIRRIQDGRP